ncbi:tail fiber domain-containing protein [Candidatus Nitrotoga fabula]|uniref:Peptidase S74 domain-containing protein n=1 Tax=Candidatus Nitrotoga fabula TaxID=2182327 RepID=A0A916FBZ8_9PROT|nr:tail fiber domain-containing protein [Candidatus Nitrotoga fabula]CAE6718214.1 conserved hypothetical protein [Candidatus Nitrotoga fabula]
MNKMQSLLAPYGSLGFVSLATKVGGEGKGPPISDIRFKKDIQLLTMLEDGMKIYSFRYHWSDEVFVGIMAQDCLEHPEWKKAVCIRPDGFYGVDYAKLGLRKTTIEIWNERGLDSIKLVSSPVALEG